MPALAHAAYAVMQGFAATDAMRGANGLQLEAVDHHLKPGDWVRLTMSDPPTGSEGAGSLVSHLYQGPPASRPIFNPTVVASNDLWAAAAVLLRQVPASENLQEAPNWRASSAGAAEIANKGELGIAQLVGTPNVVSFIARVASIEGNLVQVGAKFNCSMRSCPDDPHKRLKHSAHSMSWQLLVSTQHEQDGCQEQFVHNLQSVRDVDLS